MKNCQTSRHQANKKPPAGRERLDCKEDDFGYLVGSIVIPPWL